MHETGVSLGGGCLRGVAHIGALMEIINHDISITHVAGTSAGAVIGGLYACGIHPDRMVNVLESLSIRKHLDFGFNMKGCLGEVAKALRASIAIPGVFLPVEMSGKLLVDGYILNNNPADVVKEMGAKHVTAIRVLSSNNQKQIPKYLISYLYRYADIASYTHTDQILKHHADILIDIDLVDVGRFDTKSFPVVIQRGQAEARKVLAKEKARVSVGRVIYMDQWLKKTSI